MILKGSSLLSLALYIKQSSIIFFAENRSTKIIGNKMYSMAFDSNYKSLSRPYSIKKTIFINSIAYLKETSLMKYLFSLLFTLSALFATIAQKGSTFPPMEGESLTNEFINIPEDLKGKYSFIGLAYSKKSEDYLKTWFEPIYNQFIYKSEKPGLFDFTYDINLYFVPMITGAKRPAYQGVMNKIKKTVDKRLLPHILFYKGELNKYKKTLNFKGKDVPYFFILDPDGTVIYQTYGKYTVSKMEEIVEKVDDALTL